MSVVRDRAQDRDPSPDWLGLWGLRAWRAIGLAVAAYLLFRFMGMVKVVALPLLLGLFPAAVLLPATRWLRHRGWPDSLAALATLVPTLAVIASTFWFIAPSLVRGLGDIGQDLSRAAESFRAWLVNGPLGLSQQRVDSYWEQMVSSFTENGASTLLGGAEAVAGLLLTVVVAFFLLKDFDRITGETADDFSDDRTHKIYASVRVARQTLGRYIGGLAFVGLFDAVLIGIGLAIIGVPLVLPLSVLIFWGAFFPIVGAWITGLIAVAVALVNGSLTDAVIVLILITVVQQLEGDLVLPLVFGNVLPLHPLVVLIGVIGGGALFGVAGAFIVVPALAVVVAVRRSLKGPQNETDGEKERIAQAGVS